MFQNYYFSCILLASWHQLPHPLIDRTKRASPHQLSHPSIMKGLSALRAERGQLSLTSSFYASAHPAEGFSIMGKCQAVSYDRKKRRVFITHRLQKLLIHIGAETLSHRLRRLRHTLPRSMVLLFLYDVSSLLCNQNMLPPREGIRGLPESQLAR